MLGLRTKVKENCTINKQAELEIKLKNSLSTTIELKKEIRIVNNLQKDQGRELERMIKHNAFEKRINSLNDYLNRAKKRVKELENKLQAKGIQNDKYKEQIEYLRGRLQYLMSTIYNEPFYVKQSTIEVYKDPIMLKANLELLKDTLEKIRLHNNKEIEVILMDIKNLKEGAQRTNKESNQVTVKLRGLNEIIKMNKTQKPIHPITSRRNAFSVMKKRLENSIMIHNDNLSVILLKKLDECDSK